MENLPNIFFPLNFDVQSITCEMFGSRLPHLVKYPFDLKLKPLFYTSTEGIITPITDTDEDMVIVPFDDESSVQEALQTATALGLGAYSGPVDFGQGSDLVQVEAFCSLLLQKAFEVNAAYRQENNLPENCYWFEHFLVEGWVLYALDESGAVPDGAVFALKPPDTCQSHVEKFDVGIQTKTLMALRELRGKGKSVITQGNMKTELNFSNSQWTRWGKDVMELVEGIPLPRNIRDMPKNAQRVMILVGIPGSGKSTFSKQLVGRGWERCNQDELGHRRKVEQMVAQYLKEGKNVVVDRCNFDISQRHVWVKLASSHGVPWLICVILRTPPDVCKRRVSARTDHPTIPAGESGHAIVDKFKEIFVDPSVYEGFCEIDELRNEQDVAEAVAKYSLNASRSVSPKRKEIEKIVDSGDE